MSAKETAVHPLFKKYYLPYPVDYWHLRCIMVPVTVLIFLLCHEAFACFFHTSALIRVGTKTLFSLFAKMKTLTKSVTVFAKFRLFFAKGFRENFNLTKDGKNSIYRGF
jgi:hypothetical protein